ncbi:MAG: glycosyltransferase [Janthinobacterium lividum]
MPHHQGHDAGRSGAGLLLQAVPTRCPTALRDLYWRAERDAPGPGGVEAEAHPDGRICFGEGTRLRFDTYFGALFETQWRLHTRLGAVELRVRVEGRVRLRVLRRGPGRVTLLHEAASTGPELRVTLGDGAASFRQHGALYFEVVALDGPAVLHRAEWVAPEERGEPVRLAAVFCTFNREADIARVLGTLADAPAVMARLARVIVVSQGRPGLAAHPLVAPVAARLGAKLTLVEQGNHGGAGGFGRGLLEAIDDPAVDHVAFLDDDVVLEADSLLRMSSFLTLARGDLAVGGHMLDGAQPTRLFEAGATIGERHWDLHPEHGDLDVAAPEALGVLCDPRPVHYNGWWCFGFPLRLVERVGMPLPCFIRGDDTEFGLRLYEAGIRTVPVPGIAVWHEPFYLRLGGWQLYYETRNMLVAMALHRPDRPRAVTRRMARQVLLHLMTYRYYSTALVVRGIEDFLAGPDVFRGSPAARHAGLGALRQAYPQEAVPRSAVLQPHAVPPLPRGRAGYLWALGRALVRNALAPTRGGPARRLAVGDFAWVTLAGSDRVALETWWDTELPDLHRSRERFRDLARQAARALWALQRHGPAAAARWREAAPELRSVGFWRDTLDVPERVVAPLLAVAE